jgi:hypothetical protein
MARKGIEMFSGGRAGVRSPGEAGEMKKYPTELLIVEERDDKETYLLAFKTAEDVSQVHGDDAVAVYRFVKMARVKTVSTLS